MLALRPRSIAAGVVLLALAITVVAAALRLVTFERHRGYFGPAWSADGGTVYCFERDTRGLTWGPGLEFFTPPAHAWVVSDVLSLCAIDAASGRTRVLERIRGGPVQGRATSNYRNRIFGIPHVRIDATGDSLKYLVTLSLPRVPSGDPWYVRGTWPRAGRETPRWRNESTPDGGPSEPVLLEGRELLVTDGAAAYPAAILMVNADTSYVPLVHTAELERLHPGGVLRQWIAERWRRPQIMREREFARVHGELVQAYRSQGRSEGDAILGAYDRMKDLGYLPRDPVVVARVLEGPAHEPVFEIPSAYFEVGLFKDIAAAITAPGESIVTDTGDYLKYYDDDVGPRLSAYRRTHPTFVVRVDGRAYRLEAVAPR